MLQYVVPFVIALVVSYLLTPSVKKLAIKIGAVDRPNARKVHTHVIPRLGGLAAGDQVLALPGCHLHLYGKAQAQRGRKMGHLNITATTAEAARATALQAAAIVGIEAF